MRQPPDRISRQGYTLIELCAVMATLGMTLSLGAIILLVAMRANQVGGATLLQVRLRTDVADTFRADVAGSTQIPTTLGQRTRSPTCLILRRQNGDHVVYEWQNGQLTRTVLAGEQESRSILSIGIPDIAIEFSSAGEASAVVTMRVDESLGHGIVRRSEFAAALGGDRR
jgi:type II secretory pathway pseudopilin PulG